MKRGTKRVNDLDSLCRVHEMTPEEVTRTVHASFIRQHDYTLLTREGTITHVSNEGRKTVNLCHDAIATYTE